MRVYFCYPLIGLFVLVSLAGCKEGTPAKPQVEATAPQPTTKVDEKAKFEAEIAAELAKLSPEDRKLAEAQRFCVVPDYARLGEMGEPFKITVKGESVFLCCEGCTKYVNKDPDKALAKLKELKAKSTPPAK